MLSAIRYRGFRACDACLLLCARQTGDVFHPLARAIAPDLRDDTTSRVDEDLERRHLGEIAHPCETDDSRRQRRLERAHVERAGEQLCGETRDQRGAEARRHEPLDDVVVIRAQYEVWIDAVGAELVDDALRAAGALEADQVQAAQIGGVP